MLTEEKLNLSRYLGHGLAVRLNPIGGTTVMDLTLFVELPKSLGVREQRSPVIFADSAPQFIHWSIEKDNLRLGLFQKFDVCHLAEGASAQGHDGGISIGKGVEEFSQCLGLQLAEGRLTHILEDVGDGIPGTRLDLAVEVDEAPPKPLT